MPNIMYHFVACEQKLKGISLESFRAQLDFLQRTFDEEDIVLTFDHGTIDHLLHVAPELERRDLRGRFFVMTMVPEERRIPASEKQRFLEAERRRQLAAMLCAEVGLEYRPHDADGYLADFAFYSLEERYLRFLRNTCVDARAFERFIDRHFGDAFGDEAAFVSRWYLSWEQIAELRARGHIIGTHTHRHHGDRADCRRSVDLLWERLDVRVRELSYPGGEKRVSDTHLQDMGIETAYVSRPDGAGRYQTGRIDCNQWTLS
jgi:peptidoglycan/xylan/chitin deacetylase (PgdA/CDA1 family)